MLTEFYPFGSTITGICTGTARQVSEQGKLEYEFGKPLWIISMLPIKITHFSSIINGVTTSVTL